MGIVHFDSIKYWSYFKIKSNQAQTRYSNFIYKFNFLTFFWIKFYKLKLCLSKICIEKILLQCLVFF